MQGGTQRILRVEPVVPLRAAPTRQPLAPNPNHFPPIPPCRFYKHATPAELISHGLIPLNTAHKAGGYLSVIFVISCSNPRRLNGLEDGGAGGGARDEEGGRDLRPLLVFGG